MDFGIVMDFFRNYDEFIAYDADADIRSIYFFLLLFFGNKYYMSLKTIMFDSNTHRTCD